MFLVNGIYGIAAGTWALIVSTVLAIVAMLWMLGRPPILPFIAGAVSDHVRHADADHRRCHVGADQGHPVQRAVRGLPVRSACGLATNFFQFVFGKTFHYTEEGWDQVHAQLRLVLPLHRRRNEAVRLSFKDEHIYDILGLHIGVDIWILFKIFMIMPVTGLFAWCLMRLMQRYRMPSRRDRHAAPICPAAVDTAPRECPDAAERSSREASEREANLGSSTTEPAADWGARARWLKTARQTSASTSRSCSSC